MENETQRSVQGKSLIVAMEAITPSKLNPRRTVNGPALEELTSSVRSHGVLQPILVRPIDGNGSYELVAGHRRFAAASKAGLDLIPAFVRELTDQEVLEIMLIENLQRADLHPLEEAEGYRQLVATKKYDAARIAERIGRSAKYVYDRMKLLSLTKEAKKLFLEDRITAGHAIILARLSSQDQARAIDPENADRYGGKDCPLFQYEASLFTDAEDEKLEERRAEDAYFGLKTKSVREFQGWVDRHVRFDPAAPDVPDLFPETHRVIEEAKAEKVKLIPVTEDYHLEQEVRNGTRVYGPMSWRRADEKPCDHSILGVVVAGAGRGQAFDVCIEKEKCKTHWADWQRERAKRAKKQATGGATGKQESHQDRWEKERLARDAELARWKKAMPTILDAVRGKIAEASAGATGKLSEFVLGEMDFETPKEGIARGKTADDLIRYIAWGLVLDISDRIWDGKALAKKIALLGVDANRIVNEVAPKEKVQTSAPPKAAAKKTAARKKR